MRTHADIHFWQSRSRLYLLKEKDFISENYFTKRNILVLWSVLQTKLCKHERHNIFVHILLWPKYEILLSIQCWLISFCPSDGLTRNNKVSMWNKYKHHLFLICPCALIWQCIFSNINWWDIQKRKWSSCFVVSLLILNNYLSFFFTLFEAILLQAVHEWKKC